MGNVNYEDDAVGMFLIVVVITRVFCYWILQQLTTHVHLAFPWFGPGLMNSYYNLTAPGDALCW